MLRNCLKFEANNIEFSEEMHSTTNLFNHTSINFYISYTFNNHRFH